MSNKYDITLTDAAARHIVNLVTKTNSFPVPGCVEDAMGLRIEVTAGGCSGFTYKYEIADTMEETDLLIMNGDARLVIDEQSAEKLRGATIDFKSDIMGQHFDVANPNATGCCGCGKSFS